MAILLAFLTSLFYGVFDFAGGMATRRAPVFSVAFWANVSGLVLSVVISAGHHLWNGAIFTFNDLAWGALSGVAGVIGVLFYFQGLAKGRMAVVAPVSAITLSLMPFLFGFITGERYAILSWIGVVLAAPALWLTVATRQVQQRPGKAAYGLAAGLSFSVVFIGMAQISPEAGMWPLVTFKIGSLAAVGILIKIRHVPLRLQGRGRLLALAAGGTTLANLTYLLAVQIGPLGLVAVVSSFYPGVVALLAFLVFKEKITRTRLAGLTLSLIAVSLIAL
jgi:uncharacterized membrane protein